MPGAQLIGAVHSDERVEVTVRVRSRSWAATAAATALAAQSLGARRYLTRDELRATRGADPADIAAVRSFAAAQGLEVIEADAAQRKVVLAGPAQKVSAAFGVTLQRYQYAEGTYRGRTGPVSVPAELGVIVEGVFGLDDRPQARPHFRVLPTELDPVATPFGARRSPATPATSATSFTPPQVARLYDFEPTATGKGQCIALIELSGGLRRGDLQAYFAQLGIPAPTIVAVSVDGATSHPTTPNSADGEVMLDIEVAGSVAPGARIAVYFAPNTDRGFLDAVTAAVHDTVNTPSVISISWGGAEVHWTAQAMQALDQAFQDAALVGVTVLCASGDDGSDDAVADGLAHADFPASSPHAVGCGGTRLFASPSAISDERVWNDGPEGGATGGGVSDVFDPPAYQAGAGVPRSANPGGRVGRGVPDLAGDASPASGYAVRVDGQPMVIGGTSAVAPLLAALVAQLNQQLETPVGFLNPLLYAAPARVFRDITIGGNGAYAAGTGWDACTGLGRPDGAALLAVLRAPDGA
ncbi:MAG: S8/S53 family peptidase [Chloroflexi bacterium]|nr:S8/S53 family peptidase [Chloroflexota bacterium]